MSRNTLQGTAPLARLRKKKAVREERAILWLMTVLIMALPISIFNKLSSLFYVALLILIVLLLIVSFAASNEPLDAPLLAIGMAMSCYLFVCGVGNGDYPVSRYIQYAIIFLSLLAVSRHHWQQSEIGLINRAFMLLMIASALLWIVSGMPTNYYASFYGHSNGFANVIFCAVVIKTMEIALRESKCPNAKDVIYYILCIVLLTVANSRSTMFALIMFAITLPMLHRAAQSGGVTKCAVVLFALTTLIILAFSIVYPSLYGTSIGYQIEMFSREYFNKNFFSGREIIWGMILSSVEGSELFGLGLSMDPSKIYNTDYSSHNMYLQTILQSGIIGLTFILGMLLFVTVRLSKQPSPVCHIGIALIIGLLIHEGFEVTLTQNNFSYGTAYWMLIAICLSIKLKISQFESNGFQN